MTKPFARTGCEGHHACVAKGHDAPCGLLALRIGRARAGRRLVSLQGIVRVVRGYRRRLRYPGVGQHRGKLSYTVVAAARQVGSFSPTIAVANDRSGPTVKYRSCRQVYRSLAPILQCVADCTDVYVAVRFLPLAESRIPFARRRGHDRNGHGHPYEPEHGDGGNHVKLLCRRLRLQRRGSSGHHLDRRGGGEETGGVHDFRAVVGENLRLCGQ